MNKPADTVVVPSFLPLSQIMVESNVRLVDAEKTSDWAEFLESVRQYGVLQSVTVERRGNAFVLRAGHRRFHAAKTLGFEQIPVTVYTGPKVDMVDVTMAENIMRTDLHWTEICTAYKSRKAAKPNEKIGEVGKAWGLSPSRMTEIAKLADAPFLGLAVERFKAGQDVLPMHGALKLLAKAGEVKAREEKVDEEGNVTQEAREGVRALTKEEVVAAFTDLSTGSGFKDPRKDAPTEKPTGKVLAAMLSCLDTGHKGKALSDEQKIARDVLRWVLGYVQTVPKPIAAAQKAFEPAE